MTDWPGTPKDQSQWPGTPKEEQPSTLGDVAHSALTGVGKGLIDFAGLPGDAANLLGMGADWVAEKITGEKPATNPSLLPTSHNIQNKIEEYTGKFYEPQTTLGKYAGTGAEFLANPASYVGPGGMLAKAGTTATAALGSEAAGQMFDDSPYARLAGAILGGSAPRIAARAITPLPSSPQHAANVANLRAEGIEPTAGQVAGNRSLRYAEEHLGALPGAGGAAQAEEERIARELTRATLRRVGVNADEATPQVVDTAFRRIGNEFDTLAARNQARADPQYVQDMHNARNDYDHLFVDPLRAPLVDNVFNHSMNQMVQNQGVMTGDIYQAVRSRIERFRRSNARDPELSGFLAEMRDGMDSLMERSIARNNPADAGAWREVRNQYRNMLVVERMNVAGGQQAAEGMVTPGRLRQATVTTQGRRNYARGHGDFADLARSANAVLSPLPQSGTAPRAAMHAIAGGIGGTLGHVMAGAPGAAVGTLAAAASPGLTGRVLMSTPVQDYLKNQRMAQFIRTLPPATLRSLLSAMSKSQRTEQ